MRLKCNRFICRKSIRVFVAWCLLAKWVESAEIHLLADSPSAHTTSFQLVQCSTQRILQEIKRQKSNARYIFKDVDRGNYVVREVTEQNNCYRASLVDLISDRVDVVFDEMRTFPVELEWEIGVIPRLNDKSKFLVQVMAFDDEAGALGWHSKDVPIYEDGMIRSQLPGLRTGVTCSFQLYHGGELLSKMLVQFDKEVDKLVFKVEKTVGSVED